MIGPVRKVFAAAFAASIVSAIPAPAQAADAVCYNCPPEWADWASQLAAIKADTGIAVPHDNKNSGQSLAQLLAEKDNPVADVVYLGVSFGIQAAEKGVVTGYKPKNWNEIPADLKDPDGKWFTIHSGTIGLMVNVDALGGRPVPKRWSDLLKPDYKGMVGYLDPTSAFVGYVGATAVNRAMGGSFANWEPGLAFFKALAANDPIVPKQTSYARVLSGEIPILFDYDFNAYRAKYKDGANVVFVIPEEGTVVVPYVMSLVKGGPHPEQGKAVLDYVLSDKGQSLWAEAFLRPVRANAMSPAAKAKFLPDADYARARAVDFKAMAAAQDAFKAAYLAEVR